MTDLILVDPPVAFSARLGKLAKAGSFLPSLGLGFLAAVARDESFSVRIIDANVLGLLIPGLVNEIIKEKPKWVGISATTLTIDTVGKIASALKKKLPEIEVIVGGAHITAVPQETLEKYKAIDIGVIGEGEVTFKELLLALSKNKDIRKIKGIITKDKGKLVITPPREFIQNLDELPFPAWDLFYGFPGKYRPSVNSFLKLPAAHIFTSRGCTGRCLFCDRSVFGRLPRMHSAKRVLEMIEYLVKNYGIREIQFFDDNLALFPRRLEEICQGLRRKKWDLTWSCQARCDMLNPEKLRMMKEAGCWQIGLGIESGSDKILGILQKGETRKQMSKVVKDIAEAGIEPKGFFILGNPGETRETLQETEDFILSLPLAYAHTTYFTPYPGSEVYKQAKEFGVFKFDNDWSKLGQGTIRAVFVPKGLSRKDLELKAAEIFRNFYFRPSVIYSHFKKALTRPQIWPFYFRGLFSVLSFAQK